METAWLEAPPSYDRRYVQVQRPVVLTGGELTLEQLDLEYDTDTKFYQAPFQMKANGGMFIIDDFGRQQVPPQDLLNRWIVPLEKRIDFLTLHTGKKFQVPFDCLLIFSTNLEPRELVDEAFLRRIHYKIQVESPTRRSTPRSSAAAAPSGGIAYEPGGAARLPGVYGRQRSRPRMPSAGPPGPSQRHRQLLGAGAELAHDLVDRACRSYFLSIK